MFDTQNSVSKVNFNAPATGIIQRSHEKAFFLRFHMESMIAKGIFSDNSEYKNQPVVILQILLASDKTLLVELVKEKDLMP